MLYDALSVNMQLLAGKTYILSITMDILALNIRMLPVNARIEPRETHKTDSQIGDLSFFALVFFPHLARFPGICLSRRGLKQAQKKGCKDALIVLVSE